MSKRECDIDLYAGLSQVQSKLTALEARVAALEASNSPGGLEGAPDNTPGGDVCEAVCRACQGSGYADYAAVPCPACETVPPDPVPQWRASVDAAKHFLTGEDPLVTVLRSLACVADDSKVTDVNLARIVAVAEGQVGDGWKADPYDAGRPKGGVYDAEYLIYALAWTTPGDGRWRVLGDRAAAWLLSLLDGAS